MYTYTSTYLPSDEEVRINQEMKVKKGYYHNKHRIWTLKQDEVIQLLMNDLKLGLNKLAI